MEVDVIIKKVVKALKKVEGIEAIVLGGSRAKGNFTTKSDLDIGIYYKDSSQLDLEMMSQIATELDDSNRADIITKIGEWGPWINGGGWLNIDGVATDFLFRDINKVSNVIDDCLNKKITIDYQPGHPHGFVNAIYAAETYYCKILWSNSEFLTNLKDKITPYPLSIKTGIIDKFSWEALFFIGIAYKSLPKNDIAYTTGCIYRIVSCLLQVLFALNETYIMNEKGALLITDTFRSKPKDFKKNIENIFCSLTMNPGNLENLLDQLSDVVKEIEELCRV